jgi:hypothetical protein
MLIEFSPAQRHLGQSSASWTDSSPAKEQETKFEFELTATSHQASTLVHRHCNGDAAPICHLSEKAYLT